MKAKPGDMRVLHVTPHQYQPQRYVRFLWWSWWSNYGEYEASLSEAVRTCNGALACARHSPAVVWWS